MTQPPDAVLFIGFGGPTSPEEVRPFLERVVEGRVVPKQRLDLVESHYKAVGGFSPYLSLFLKQAEALRAALKTANLPLPVYVGMRNWHPTLDEAMARMKGGAQNAVGIVMAPHRSPASWENYLHAVEAARKRSQTAFRIRYVRAWHDHPLFVQAQRERILEVVGEQPCQDWERTAFLFTAHSIPVTLADRSSYPEQVIRTASLVAGSLQIPNWSVAYQSRSGSPHDRWLEPDVREAMGAAKKAGRQSVVIVPIGFLTDHVEVLYDLDVDARSMAQALDLRYLRAGTVGDHARFIEMLVELVRTT